MKVVIFDFDGTIADTLEVLLAIANRLAEEFGYPKLNLETVEQLKDLSSREIIRQSNVSLLKIPFLMRRLKQELTQDIATVLPFPGMAEVLRQLQQNGYMLGIVTSNSTPNVQTFLQIHQLSDVFNFVYSGTTLFGKHRVLNRILKQRSIDLSTVVYVGDETRDIEAAARVPIKMIAVTWGFNTRGVLARHNPHHLIDHPQDLLNILSNSF